MASIIWDTTCDNWNSFCYKWDDCTLIEEIGGAGKPPEEVWNAYKHLDKKKKKKLIKIIVWLKDEIFEEEKPVEDYNITVDDIKLLLEDYKKHKDEIKITVSNINVE